MNRAPEFRPMWEAARRRARERTLRRRKLGAVAGVAGAFLIGALMLPARRTPAPDLDAIAALSARLEATPLDFLLETPGLARLETVPEFGDPLVEERWAAGTESEERT